MATGERGSAPRHRLRPQRSGGPGWRAGVPGLHESAAKEAWGCQKSPVAAARRVKGPCPVRPGAKAVERRRRWGRCTGWPISAGSAHPSTPWSGWLWLLRVSMPGPVVRPRGDRRRAAWTSLVSQASGAQHGGCGRKRASGPGPWAWSGFAADPPPGRQQRRSPAVPDLGRHPPPWCVPATLKAQAACTGATGPGQPAGAFQWRVSLPTGRERFNPAASSMACPGDGLPGRTCGAAGRGARYAHAASGVRSWSARASRTNRRRGRRPPAPARQQHRRARSRACPASRAHRRSDRAR